MFSGLGNHVWGDNPQRGCKLACLDVVRNFGLRGDRVDVFADKEAVFVNDPRLCSFYRDKMNVISGLNRDKIFQPPLHDISGTDRLQDELDDGKRFFIKPRYGSMGKGITYVSPSDWQTNFTVKGNRIISKKSDHGWKFKDVTGNRKFLKKILQKDMLVQEAVDSPIVKGNKVDIRFYIFFGKAIYIYPRKNKPDKVTTNISQGGKGAPAFVKELPAGFIKKAKKEAERAADVLGLKLAGVDIIPGRGFKKPYIIDVNVFSGFPKRRTFNLSKQMVMELGKLNRKGKLDFKPIGAR